MRVEGCGLRVDGYRLLIPPSQWQLNDIGVVERDGLRVDSEYLEAIAHNIQCSLDRPSSTRAKSRNVAHWAALMTVCP